MSPAYFYYMHRNQAIFMRRNASLARQSLFFPGYVAGMAKGWLAWSVRRRPKATTVFLRALLDGCLMRTGRVSI